MQGDTGSVPALLHAADSVVFHHELLGHVVHPFHEFDHLVAAAAATGACGKIVEVVHGNGGAHMDLTFSD